MVLGEGKPRRRWPTLEILAMEFSTAYRFPIPEVLIFLYVFFPLFFSHVARAIPVSTEEASLLLVISLSQGVMGLITLILILRNVAYGLANEIKKGLMQTYLTYPVGRGRLLLVKLISGILVPIGFVATSVLVFTAINFPELALKYPHVLVVGLASSLGEILLLGSIMFLSAIIIKRGGTSLAVGIALMFILQIADLALSITASITGWEGLWHIRYLLGPSLAFLTYYQAPGAQAGVVVSDGETFVPEFWECMGYLVGHYALIIAICLASLIYFMRRFEPT